MNDSPSQVIPTDVPVRAMLAEARRPFGPYRWCVFAVSVILAVWGLGWSSWRIATEGVGVMGVNNSVPWGLDIVHFVFWIGLGHAGTLISAVLLLSRQSWRNPIARGAEQMTLCAVICAAVFPIIHVGRVWMAWLVSPLPETSGIWPDIASPLMWDVMAVSTYFLLSAAYWYMGLIPDFALLRDCCKGKQRRRYGLLALGWQGTSRQWRAYEKAGLLFAAILTPLVVSVHSVVSFDFAVTQTPGWHESIFPPYFVGGAILSGMAMVQLILLTVRRLTRAGGVKEALTPAILDLSSKMVLALSLVMGVMYLWEHMGAVIGGEHAPISPLTWWMIGLNVLLPQVFWVRSLRRHPLIIALVAAGVLVGMWLERFWIVVDGLKDSLLSGGAGEYSPTLTDFAMMAGSVGLFVALYLTLAHWSPFFSLCDAREQRSLEKEARL